MSRREHVRAIMAALEGWGATGLVVVPGGRHRRLWFTFAGRRRFYVLPGNLGGYQSAVENCLADLRRMLGIARPATASRHRRRRRAGRAAAPCPCPPITVFPDPWRPLAAHPALAALRARQLDEAWWRFWRAHMRAVAGRDTAWL